MFATSFRKGNNFHDFLIASLDVVRPTLKGKNLLLAEQIVFFKSLTLLGKSVNFLFHKRYVWQDHKQICF